MQRSNGITNLYSMLVDVDNKLHTDMFAMYNCPMYDPSILLLYAMFNTTISKATKY